LILLTSVGSAAGSGETPASAATSPRHYGRESSAAFAALLIRSDALLRSRRDRFVALTAPHAIAAMFIVRPTLSTNAGK
jgi:hypothetical protein